MALADDLTALGHQGSDMRATAPQEAWRPRLELDAAGGYFVSTPRAADTNPDAVDLLGEFNLDPTIWRVVSVRRSKWQKHDGEWLEAFRVSLAPAATVAEDNDLTQLVDEVRRWKPKNLRYTTGDAAFVFAVGDTQYGKDAGGGTSATVETVLNGFEHGVQRLKDLRRIGRSVGTIVLPQLGDCIEGSSSQKGKLLARSDLGVTQQVRLGRRMLMAQIKTFAPHAERIIVPVVPGNHDDPHRIQATDPVDSWQVEVAAAVQDACAENDALAHVEFRYPERDGQTLAVDVCGTILGFAHGHQSRDAGTWWHGQAAGRTPVGSADVLLTGHLHHFKAANIGPRLWVQVPAADGGSPWFRDKTGLDSPTGFVTMLVGDGIDPREHLAVIGGNPR